MALLDFLKNKKEKEKAKEKKPVAKASVTPKVEKTEKTPTAKAGKSNNFTYTVVRQPHISEKATNLAENNKYTFKVYENANKPEIKKSVEGIYNVDVLSVNIIKSPRKKRRLGKTQGFKKAFTKAVVTIGAGQKIEIF